MRTDGGLGVEELEVVVAHGVFEAAEVGEEIGEEEAPEDVGVRLSAGEVEVGQGAEVMRVGLFDEGDDLLR